MMNKPVAQETHDQQNLAEDLSVGKDRAAQIKGGPIEIREIPIRVVVNPQ